MKKLLAVCIIMTTMYQVAMANKQVKIAYIEQYTTIAIQEMQRSGVPASIKLAQALLESDAGMSSLAKGSNNHFGIKCGSNWGGKKMFRKDDDYRKGKLIKSCFRAYKNPESSFIAHTDFLLKQPRYAFLFKLDPTNYKAWARGLKKAGYATDPNYAKRLISIVQSYQLDQFDRTGDGAFRNKPLIFSGEVDLLDFDKSLQYINDVKSVLAEEAHSVEDVALNYGVSIKKIMKYNEHFKSSNQILYTGEIVYLQPKRKNYRGKQKYHIVKKGETMQLISQKYGIKLIELYKKNRIQEGKQPDFGEKLVLRGKISKKEIPTVRLMHHPTRAVSDTFPAEDRKEKDTKVSKLVTIDQRNSSKSIVDSQVIFYTVKSGDTLYKLARKFSLSVDEIKQINTMDSNIIKVGQKLKVSL